MDTEGEEDGCISVGRAVIEKLFVHRDAIARHLAAPMLPERQAYLGRLLASGFKRKFVADRASTLCHIANRQWFTGPQVTEQEILTVLIQWLGGSAPQDVNALKHRGKYFIALVRNWTKFLGSYVPDTGIDCRLRNELAEFTTWLRHDAGFLESSIDSCVAELKVFLIWLSPKCSDLSSVKQIDVDAYIAERRSSGRSRNTIIGECQAIRTFFRYAEERGWSRNSLSKTIRAPSQHADESRPRCPPWRQIRRTLTVLDTPYPSCVRARAILFLASIYGLRRSEIGRLTLDDLDWQNEIITVRRSKRGRIQQFPLQFEVGEALIRYLRIRPKCRFREVFLTLRLPFRPAKNFSGAMRKLLNAQRTFDRPWGMHAFRHACATELLRKGTSLRGIADFLGHKDIQSVSVYAHSDLRALREVANFSLDGLICD